MKIITSLFDFFNKVKKDRRYEKVAIIAYKDSWIDFHSQLNVEVEYQQAKEWIKDWVNNNSSRDGFDCGRMTRYLNECMRKIPKWQDDAPDPPVSNHNMT